MPYKIVKQGNRWVVMKKDGSKVFGTHASADKAEKQLRALYANEKK